MKFGRFRRTSEAERRETPKMSIIVAPQPPAAKIGLEAMRRGRNVA